MRRTAAAARSRAPRAHGKSGIGNRQAFAFTAAIAEDDLLTSSSSPA